MCAGKWRHLAKFNNPDFAYENRVYVHTYVHVYKSARNRGMNLKHWHGVTRCHGEILYDV